MAETPRLLRRGGVRVRAAGAATLVAALFLAAAGALLVVVQRHQLETALSDLAVQQASTVADRVATEGQGVDLRTGGSGERALVQVVDASGAVVATSPSIEGEAAVVDLRPRAGETSTVQRNGLPIGEGEPFVVAARGVSGPSGPMVVLAAQSLESVQRSTAVTVALLGVGYPLVLLAVAGTSYWATGRALTPVEAIRTRVATIENTSQLDARVPVPDTDDEIARLAQTMNSMLIRLQYATESQRQFVADASHELRSPLSTVRALHEVAIAHPQALAWQDLSAEVLPELDRVDRLVADMLLLAKSDEQQLALQVEDVDLDHLVESAAVRLRRGGVHHVTVHTTPVRVVGDSDRLARAIRNLTDNAARYAAGRVDLTVRLDHTTAVVDVIDDGPGIVESDRGRVFERFVRLDQSRARESGGSGLGLSIAREIARLHGGDVTFAPSVSGAHVVLTVRALSHNEARR